MVLQQKLKVAAVLPKLLFHELLKVLSKQRCNRGGRGEVENSWP